MSRFSFWQQTVPIDHFHISGNNGLGCTNEQKTGKNKLHRGRVGQYIFHLWTRMIVKAESEYKLDRVRVSKGNYTHGGNTEHPTKFVLILLVVFVMFLKS